MNLDWNQLAKSEDTIIELINSGSQLFSKSLFNIELAPTYRYLVEHFWYAPDTSEYWLAKFRMAAIISRRIRCERQHTVTILGETGTGKEIFARAFAAGRTFVALNCTALPAELLESELFGSTSGAFTGARDRIGLLESAGNGLAFLDEICDMPLQLQAKLLRTLQERKVRPLGTNQEKEIYCQIICASNGDMRKSLRTDLYWRLSTYILELPSWHKRLSEVDWMVRCKLDQAQLLEPEDRAEIVRQMAASTGNFRELVALCERAKAQKWLARCTNKHTA